MKKLKDYMDKIKENKTVLGDTYRASVVNMLNELEDRVSKIEKIIKK